MPIEPSVIIAGTAVVLSTIGLIRTEQRARKGLSETRWKLLETQLLEGHKRMQTHYEEFLILRAQVTPLISALASRVSAMFHQDDNALGFDEIIERFNADPTDAKWSISDEDLEQYIEHTQRWYSRVKKDGPDPNRTEELAAAVWSALWLSLREIRKTLREREARELEAKGERDQIADYFRQMQQPPTPPAASWWTSLKQWFGGS